MTCLQTNNQVIFFQVEVVAQLSYLAEVVVVSFPAGFA
jgi:hypothetical protein